MYEYEVTVDRVVDGDTIDVNINLGFSVVLAKKRVRLYGIDTPESRTRDKEEKVRGLLSKSFLQAQCPVGSPVKLISHDIGKFVLIIGSIAYMVVYKNIGVQFMKEFCKAFGVSRIRFNKIPI